MKRLFRALVGILATIVIVMMIERTMINFEFFPEDTETETQTAAKQKADSVAVAQIAQDSITSPDSIATEQAKNQLNPIIKSKDLVDISDSKQLEANKVYKKEVSFDDNYMINFDYLDTIPNYANSITVAFEFENKDFAENVLFIVFDCLDKQSSKLIKRFYEPVSGTNRVKLNKEKLSAGMQTFRIGYFLKKGATKNRLVFYNKELNIYIEE